MTLDLGIGGMSRETMAEFNKGLQEFIQLDQTIEKSKVNSRGGDMDDMEQSKV